MHLLLFTLVVIYFQKTYFFHKNEKIRIKNYKKLL